jgi:acyl carrier protein phosphodiesterase
MNYLAHAYFSFQHPPWVVGNLISDFVKGRSQYQFPPAVQQGIRLHRFIDAFTDGHEATRQAKEFFRPAYRLYAGAFVDVVYDHFLANDPVHFESELALESFCTGVYGQVQAYDPLLPQVFQQVFVQMKQQNWLGNYRHGWGVEKSFGGIVYRSKYLSDASAAIDAFYSNYDALRQCYLLFAPDLVKVLTNEISDWQREG